MVETEQGIKEGISTFLTFGAKSVQPQLLERLLVGRKEIVDNLQKYALQIARHGLNQQVIVVGSRGSGKTHILRVLFHRIQPLLRDGELVVAYFAEEEYGIDGYLDFLIRIIKAFKRWYEKDAALLESKLDILRDTPFSRQEELAESIILEYIGEKPLLILAENFNDILEALDKAGQNKLRAFLYRHNRTSIIATSQAVSLDLKKEDRPFYNFFTPVYLQKLSYGQSLALLQELALIEGKPELIEHLQSNGKAQVRAIYELVKGNHRLLVTFFEFLKADSLAELSTVFMKTMNDLKPYFETFVRYLPPQQQKIIHYLALCKIPVKGSDISKHCFINDKSISKQLSELQRRRLIEAVADPSSKRDKLYDIAEPLLRIAIEIGEQKYGVTALFIDFLALYYSNEELHQQKDKFEFLFINESHGIIKQRYKYEVEARQEALRVKEQINIESDVRIREKLSRLFKQDKFKEVIDCLEDAGGVSKYKEWSFVVAYCYYQLGALDEAIFCYKQYLEMEPKSAHVRFGLGNCYDKLQQFDNAIEYYEQGLELKPDDDEVWYNLGICYSKISRFEKAIVCYSQSASIRSDVPETFCNLGICFYYTQQYQKAIDNYEKSLSLKADDYMTLANLGRTYVQLKNYTKAIAYYERSLKVNPGAAPVLGELAYCYRLSKDIDKSLATFLELLKYDPVMGLAGLILALKKDTAFLKEVCNRYPLLLESEAMYKSVNNVLLDIFKKVDKVPLSLIQYLENTINELFGPAQSLSVTMKFLEVYRRYIYEKDETAIYTLPREQREFFEQEILGNLNPDTNEIKSE